MSVSVLTVFVLLPDRFPFTKALPFRRPNNIAYSVRRVDREITILYCRMFSAAGPGALQEAQEAILEATTDRAMRRMGDVIIGRHGCKPYISVPDPWYGRLWAFRKILLVIDAMLTIGGGIAVVLGLPFGFPLLGVAIFLLLLIGVGRYVIVEAEKPTATGEPTTATGETEPADNEEAKKIRESEEDHGE